MLISPNYDIIRLQLPNIFTYKTLQLLFFMFARHGNNNLQKTVVFPVNSGKIESFPLFLRIKLFKICITYTVHSYYKK